jgi:D-amino-acid oxidase
MRPDVVVVGASVIGLTTGVCLAEAGLKVRLQSPVPPSATTSAVASAMAGPAVAPAGERAGRHEWAGLAEFTALAGVAGTGVTLRRGRLVSREQGPPLPGMQACAPGDLPPGFAAGFWATLPLVDMPVYLGYLAGRLAAAGGEFEYAKTRSLAGLTAVTPLVANCAGLGARELVPDPAVTAARGQHVVTDNPGLEEFFIEAPLGPAWAAYWPYPGHVVLGGTWVSGDERTEPDDAAAGQILRRCIRVEPRLAQARVRGHQVGLRPWPGLTFPSVPQCCRQAGIRVPARPPVPIRTIRWAGPRWSSLRCPPGTCGRWRTPAR